MSTPTTETLNGGSTLVPTQKDAQPNAATEGVKPVQRGSVKEDSTMSGMNVTSDVQVNIPVIQRGKDTLPKSGDFAKASVDRIANAGGPREQVGQFPLSSKTPAAPAPESFLGAEGSDQN